MVTVFICPVYAQEAETNINAATLTGSAGVGPDENAAAAAADESAETSLATDSSLAADEASGSEVPVRVYTDDDWDKWRVEYNRVNQRPYEESDREKKIYSYTQIPTIDTGRTKWTGEWYAIEEGGKLFANFGCGICCLANIYSTFVGKPVDPGMMLNAAKYYTSYDPGGKYGAIDWPQMKTLCEKLGMTAQVKKKPDDYAQFQKDVGDADATVVLVCKDNDPGLWFYTNGHYVTLWEYDPYDDTVYVTDSSGLFNRDRVFLKDVYDALKTKSSYQYMCVDADILGY